MINSDLTNYLLIAGIVFLVISVLGQIKLGFLEINPGCFGRTLALILGTLSLLVALGTVGLPLETFDLIKTYLTQQIQQYLG
ncbi:hypothetical protein [Nostoc sp. TCL26-01]|uniref:hypothetical protein n=1 Tax=Nostoc sp. TCL26-01 TaxID=2576904 RepID=UPI0015BEE299|nr:hypothetical protein [Nostoc sp. TCL26-01]QLE57056.1 hypothetical protein FD725_16940 [Nostoc sp. TCL26-01]